MSTTLTPPKEKTRLDNGDNGLGGAWKVIVLNDSHNTFEGVALALSQTIPGVSYDQGLQMAGDIHSKGLKIVWSGHQELAELYHEQLSAQGLTVAPLEK